MPLQVQKQKIDSTYVLKSSLTVLKTLRENYNMPVTNIICSNLHIINALYIQAFNNPSSAKSNNTKIVKHINEIERRLNVLLYLKSDYMGAFCEDVESLLTVYRALHYHLYY